MFPQKRQLRKWELLSQWDWLILYFSNFCSVREKGLQLQYWKHVRSFQLPREVCSGEQFYQESHVPSCACSPAGDQQSPSHVYRIIIFYASGMYPLIKECHLNWGFASLHMAGWACVPQEKQVQHDSSQEEGFKPFWGPVQQINSSRNRNKSSFTHLLATSSKNKCYVAFRTKIRSRLLFYCVLLIQI